MVEIGFTRSKNAVNAIMKNVVEFAICAIVFWAFCFGLMFETSNRIFCKDGFFLHDYVNISGIKVLFLRDFRKQKVML